VIAMLKEEEKVRYLPEIQEIYTEQYHLSKNPQYIRISIEIEIQKYILQKFGYSSTPESLAQYWKIPSTYWHDEEVKNSIFYMKLNIFEYPDLKVGDAVIDSTLIRYDNGNTFNLSDAQNTNRPLVLLAGSIT
jgi:hypothetical protein